MSPELERLREIAAGVVPAGSQVYVIGDYTRGGQLVYTVQVRAADGDASPRHFAIHSHALRTGFPDNVIADELRRAVNRV